MNNLTIAMSDLHGGYEQFQMLLAYIQEAYPNDNKQYIFLGDYIDRGPQTRELLDHLMSLDNGQHIFLRGNHDDMVLELSPNYVQNGNDDGFKNWMWNGGNKTLKSYPEGKMFDHHKEWLRNRTKYFHKDAQRTYVHAGFYRTYPGTASPWPIEEQEYHVLTWIREEFLNDTSDFGGYVVHGHTPTIMYNNRQPVIDITNNRCNIDTGAVYGGVLSAAIFDDSRPGPIATIDHLGKKVDIP